MSVVRVALVLWGTFFLVLGCLRTPGDGDLYWQRWLGDLILRTHQLPAALGSETFTAPGSPWVPQEWLLGIAVALAKEHQLFVLLSLLVSAVPLAILLLTYLRAREIARPEAIGVALLFCGIAMVESFGIRAQVLGWGGLALFLFFLERRDRWYYAAFPAAILWANLHASVMIAPVIVLARLAADLMDRGACALWSGRDLRMLPLALLATICTPLGMRVPQLAIALVGSPIRRYITEWQPSGLHDPSFLLGALPLAAFVIAGGRTTLWQSKMRSFPAAVLFLAMLFASRNIVLFAITAAPLAAEGLGVRFPGLQHFGRRLATMERPAIVAIAIAVFLSALIVIAQQRTGPPRLPIAAIAAIGSDPGEHRLFCEDFSWCSMALQYPQVRVFIDGRADAYPVPIWRQYVTTIKARAGWDAPLRLYHANVVLAGRKGRLSNALGKDPAWRTTYSDGQYVVFQRD